MNHQHKHDTKPDVPHTATGAELYKLVTALRRKGFTASFGKDRDPKYAKG